VPWALLLILFMSGLLLPRYFKSNSSNPESQAALAPTHCLFNETPCVIQAGSLAYTVKVVGEVSPLKPYTVILEGKDIEGVTLSFSMRDMDMGVNRFIMRNTNDITWETQAMLPVCSAGRNDWIAEFIINSANKTPLKLEYPFNTTN